MKFIKTLCTIGAVFMLNFAFAQIITSKTTEREVDTKLKFKEIKAAPTVTIAPPDDEKRKKLDDEDKEHDKSNYPYRFATLIDVNINTDNAGTWQTIDDRLVWMAEIESPKARSVNLVFKNLQIPDGAEMYLITKKKDYINGPITNKNIPISEETFYSETMPGSSVYIYYIQPKYAEGNTKFNLQILSIAYGYRGNDLYNESKYHEDIIESRSAACHINVTDTRADCFKMEQNATAHLSLPLATYTATATGVIVNNTGNNLRPLLMTADHNFTAINFNYFGALSVRFKYWQGSSAWITYTGATMIARSATLADVALLEMNQKFLPTDGIFYLGWSRSTTPPSNSTVLHHPVGDIMKITRDNQPAITNTSTIAIDLLPGRAWVQTSLNNTGDFGSYEGGSSGAALMNQNHQLVGTVSGTDPKNPQSCTNLSGPSGFGRFDFSHDWAVGTTLNPNFAAQDLIATFAIDATSVIPCTNLVQNAWAPLLTTSGGVNYTYNWTSSPNVVITGSGNAITHRALNAQSVGFADWIQCEIRTPASCGNQLIARSRKNLTWVAQSPAAVIKATNTATSQELSTVSNIPLNTCRTYSIGFGNIPIPNNVSFNWSFSGNTSQFWYTTSNGGKSITVCCYGAGTLNATVQVVNGTGCIAGAYRTYTFSGSSCTYCLVQSGTKEMSTESIKVFPNPASNTDVMVQLSQRFNINNTKITIFDIYGKQLQLLKANDFYQNIDVSRFNNGIYLIEANDGNNRETNRLIIQK